jgi:hypothetical protein
MKCILFKLRLNIVVPFRGQTMVIVILITMADNVAARIYFQNNPSGTSNHAIPSGFRTICHLEFPLYDHFIDCTLLLIPIQIEKEYQDREETKAPFPRLL